MQHEPLKKKGATPQECNTGEYNADDRNETTHKANACCVTGLIWKAQRANEARTKQRYVPACSTTARYKTASNRTGPIVVSCSVRACNLKARAMKACGPCTYNTPSHNARACNMTRGNTDAMNTTTRSGKELKGTTRRERCRKMWISPKTDTWTKVTIEN